MKMNERDIWDGRMLALLEPLRSRLTPAGSGFDLGATAAHYETATIPMEAFSRPLWGLVPFWAGGGRAPEWETLCRRGLAAGTDPQSPGYWGPCRDLDQKFVEMAAIAYGLLLTPGVLWDPLAEEEKDRLAAWLNQINRYECSQSNWQFFCILVNCALKKRGRPYSAERLELGLQRIDSYYAEGGWYRDGKNGQKDYYNGFAILFYSLLYTAVMRGEDPVRCSRFRQRAEEFARSFVYWFGDDGPAVAYGRSQTYRFAQCAFFSLCIGLEIPVLPLAVLKGLVVRHLDWWGQRSIRDNGGVLSIGYGYPNLMMSENYNAPGSPYWCMKAFAFLMLPKDHPFWTVTPAPMPALESAKPLPQADVLAQRVQGAAVIYPAGLRIGHAFPQMEEKYAKFCYSSRYSFCIARSQRTLEEAAPDSTLCFRYLGQIFVRGNGGDWTLTGNGIRWQWSALTGVEVVTEITLLADGHLRRHTVTAAFPCEAFDAGFALPADVPGALAETDGPAARAAYPGGFCAVSSLSGGTPAVLEPVPNTSLVFPKCQIPLVRYDIRPGTTVLETRVQFA